jgi:hypothetical protein
MDTKKDTAAAAHTPVEPGRRYIASRQSAKKTTPLVGRPASNLTPRDVKPLVKQKQRATGLSKPALTRTEKSKVLRRQMVERAQQQRQRARKSYGKHMLVYSSIGVTAIAAGLILWSFQGLLPSGLQLFSNSTVDQPVNKPIIQEVSSLDETQPSLSEVAMHKMGPEEPRTLKIPRISLEARIKRVGISLSGEPIATGNIFDVGWFESGGKPGIDKAVLLNGHVAGPSKDGIFAQLRNLVPGDTIQLERGDGMELTYTVVKVQEYSSNAMDMNAATQPIDPSREGLNLMTTVNKYSGRSENPDKRIVIFALQ